MISNDITLLTCSYNNNVMTKMMIMSFLKQSKKDIPIVIMDNGTVEKCGQDLKDYFTVIDNTNFKLTPNYKQISKNHCSSIDYALKNCIKTKYVLLCDNDVLFKSSLNKFFDFLDTFDEIDCIGEIGWDDAPPNRLFPYFCIINVEKFKNEKLNYFDINRCTEKNGNYNAPMGSKKRYYHDTGASFYEDIIQSKWEIKQIKINNFILHFKSVSGKNKNLLCNWLQKNKSLYEHNK